jgi:hypothetical protein
MVHAIADGRALAGRRDDGIIVVAPRPKSNTRKTKLLSLAYSLGRQKINVLAIDVVRPSVHQPARRFAFSNSQDRTSTYHTRTLTS